MYHYDIEISPEVVPPLSRKVFELFVNVERGGILGGIKPVYDGIYLFFIKAFHNVFLS